MYLIKMYLIKMYLIKMYLIKMLADANLYAATPKVSHTPGIRLPLLSGRPTVIFSAAEKYI